MTETLRISQHHPALEGHFPGNPIVPGVVILDHVITAAINAGYTVTAIGSAKFSAPLLPGQPFVITFQPKGNRLQFMVHRDEEMLAQGSMDVESPGK